MAFLLNRGLCASQDRIVEKEWTMSESKRSVGGENQMGGRTSGRCKHFIFHSIRTPQKIAHFLLALALRNNLVFETFCSHLRTPVWLFVSYYAPSSGKAGTISYLPLPFASLHLSLLVPEQRNERDIRVVYPP